MVLHGMETEYGFEYFPCPICCPKLEEWGGITSMIGAWTRPPWHLKKVRPGIPSLCCCSICSKLSPFPLRQCPGTPTTTSPTPAPRAASSTPRLTPTAPAPPPAGRRRRCRRRRPAGTASGGAWCRRGRGSRWGGWPRSRRWCSAPPPPASPSATSTAASPSSGGRTTTTAAAWPSGTRTRASGSRPGGASGPPSSPRLRTVLVRVKIKLLFISLHSFLCFPVN